MSLPMITEAELRAWSPKARPEYVIAILEGEVYLREAGILDSNLTLCHFLGQVGGETNGLTIFRESLSYTSVKAIRSAWRARAARHSDAWIQRNLIRKPVQLGDWAYGGRMGNRKGTTDGFDFRGGGLLQTTGRAAVARYAKALDVPMRNDLLDDPAVTLRFACFEWQESGCCAYAEKNDILAVSKIINTGSAKSGVMPNGMTHRKNWYAKAWEVWGDARPLPAVADVTATTLRMAGSRTLADADSLKLAGAGAGAASATLGTLKELLAPPSAPVTDLPPIALMSPVEPRSTLETMREWTDYSTAFNSLIGSLKGSIELVVSNGWLVGLALGCVAFLIGRRITTWRVEDARLGRNTGRVGDGVAQAGSGVSAGSA